MFCRKEQAAREMEAQEEEEESSGSIADSSANKSGNWEETDSCLQWIVGTKKKQEAEKQAEDRRQNGENDDDAEDAEEKFTKGWFEIHITLILLDACHAKSSNFAKTFSPLFFNSLILITALLVGPSICWLLTLWRGNTPPQCLEYHAKLCLILKALVLELLEI